MGSEVQTGQKTDTRSDRQITHDQAIAFADGHGPILSRADQHKALAGSRPHDSAHFPSNEELLRQLRTDAHKWEHTPEQLNAWTENPQHRASAFTDHEQAILQDNKQVAAYTPAQLRDIGQIVDGVQHHNPKDLQAVVARYGGDPAKIRDLNRGIQLELERRHLDKQFSAGTGLVTDGKDHVAPVLFVGKQSGGRPIEYDGPPSPSKPNPAFTLDPEFRY